MISIDLQFFGGRGSSGTGGHLSAEENKVLDKYDYLFDYDEFTRDEAVESVEDHGKWATITMSDGSIYEVYEDGNAAKRDIDDLLYKEGKEWYFGGMSDNGDTAVISYKNGASVLLGYEPTLKKPKLTGIESAIITNDTTTQIYGKATKIYFENWAVGRAQKKTNRQAYKDMDYSWRIE